MGTAVSLQLAPLPRAHEEAVQHCSDLLSFLLCPQASQDACWLPSGLANGSAFVLSAAACPLLQASFGSALHARCDAPAVPAALCGQQGLSPAFGSPALTSRQRPRPPCMRDTTPRLEGYFLTGYLRHQRIFLFPFVLQGPLIICLLSIKIPFLLVLLSSDRSSPGRSVCVAASHSQDSAGVPLPPSPSVDGAGQRLPPAPLCNALLLQPKALLGASTLQPAGSLTALDSPPHLPGVMPTQEQEFVTAPQQERGSGAGFCSH